MTQPENEPKQDQQEQQEQQEQRNQQDQQAEPGFNQDLEQTLPPAIVAGAIAAALAEDLGLSGDITSSATIPANRRASCTIAAREHGTIAGLALARRAFEQLDPACRITALVTDGAAVTPGSIVARIEGNARALLSAERVALNFMGRMSGIATLTRRYVDATTGTGARIVDTRKTTPGMRALEKYAVRAGGGMNHRAGLFDAVLIKDNHIAIAGGIAAAIMAARARAGHMVKIEVEVDTLSQLGEVLAHKVDAVLLDNMTVQELETAVSMASGSFLLEASGGVTLESVGAIARTGVDLISVGALTHSAPVLDLGFDFESRSG